jgi:hypothetical protein
MNGFVFIAWQLLKHRFVEILQRFIGGKKDFTDIIMQIVSTLQKRGIDLICRDLNEGTANSEDEV